MQRQHTPLVLVLVAGIILPLAAGSARAGPILLDPLSSGTINRHETGTRAFGTNSITYEEHGPLDGLRHRYQQCFGPTCPLGDYTDDEERGYWIFDLGPFGAILEASLELELTGRAEGMVFSGVDDIDYLTTGPLRDAWRDVRIGTKYTGIGGSLGVPVNGAGNYSINLNSAAVYRMNGASDLFAVGVYLRDPLSPVGINSVKLQLTRKMSTVSLPPTPLLLVVALLALACSARFRANVSTRAASVD